MIIYTCPETYLPFQFLYRNVRLDSINLAYAILILHIYDWSNMVMPAHENSGSTYCPSLHSGTVDDGLRCDGFDSNGNSMRHP